MGNEKLGVGQPTHFQKKRGGGEMQALALSVLITDHSK